jgi:hypothetical protein
MEKMPMRNVGEKNGETTTTTTTSRERRKENGEYIDGNIIRFLCCVCSIT